MSVVDAHRPVDVPAQDVLDALLALVDEHGREHALDYANDGAGDHHRTIRTRVRPSALNPDPGQPVARAASGPALEATLG